MKEKTINKSTQKGVIMKKMTYIFNLTLFIVCTQFAFADADTGLVVVEGKLIEKPVLRDMTRIIAIAERVAG